jgi:hypothetical protein
MSDEIKQVNMTVPQPAPKRKRTRKAPVAVKSVATPTIPVVQAAGGAPPLPSLSTTHVVGGKKKPVVKVPLPYNNSPNTPIPVSKTPVEIMPGKRITPTRKETRVHIQPTKRKNFTMKRKFKNKRITIHVDNANKVKKTIGLVEKQVADMKLSEITAKLRSRGLLREKANPPESMQRSMMKDMLLLPNSL